MADWDWKFILWGIVLLLVAGIVLWVLFDKVLDPYWAVQDAKRLEVCSGQIEARCTENSLINYTCWEDGLMRQCHYIVLPS